MHDDIRKPLWTLWITNRDQTVLSEGGFPVITTFAVPLSFWPRQLLKCWSAAAQTHRQESWAAGCSLSLNFEQRNNRVEGVISIYISEGSLQYLQSYLDTQVIIPPAWSTDGCNGWQCVRHFDSPHVCSWRPSTGPAEGDGNIREWVSVWVKTCSQFI